MKTRIMARVTSQILSTELISLLFPPFPVPLPIFPKLLACISTYYFLVFRPLLACISSHSLPIFLRTPCMYFFPLPACISPPRPPLRLDFPLPLAFLQLRRALFTNSSLPLSFPSPPTISRLDKFKKIHRQQFFRRTQVHCIQS